ncbi:unnamed protein product, partial [Amoebophrya sp. A120]|eukprot:GSA120T00008792001.1
MKFRYDVLPRRRKLPGMIVIITSAILLQCRSRAGVRHDEKADKRRLS